MKRFKDFNRLYEFEETPKVPSAEVSSFMDKLYDRIKKELMPEIPEQFKADYIRGKEITIHTGNKNDLSVGAKVENEKMTVYSKPVDKPAFEINYNFSTSDADNIINTWKKEFERSETNGLSSKSTVRKPIERDMKSFREDDDEEDIDTPILGKPPKKKRSIKINLIKQILEDAYIMDEIELNVTVEELIRRMLIAGRKK
jgi:hypothetical protein